jgi:hypothetical protein
MAARKTSIKTTKVSHPKKKKALRRMPSSSTTTTTGTGKTIHEKPPIILASEVDRYRKVPGMTTHARVEGERLQELFMDETRVPACPVEREFKTRAESQNMATILGVKLWQSHMVGVIGTLCKDSGGYPAGTTWCLDGHTRRYAWKHLFVHNLPTEMTIIEHVCDNYDDIVDQYYTYNSGDSVETPKEQIRAIIEDLEMKHPITGRTWVNGAIESRACKQGDLKTILNYVCFNYDGYKSVDGKKVFDDSCDYASSDVSNAKKGRSYRLVKTDIFRRQIIAHGDDLMLLDGLMAKVEAIKRQSLKSPGVKAKTKYGPEARWVYDGITRAALMIICKKYGNEWPKSVREALTEHVDVPDGPEYILEKGSNVAADYEYNINRIIRDAKKLPLGSVKADASNEGRSNHRINGWRDAKKPHVTRLAVMDTVWNFYCIAEHGVRAKQGEHESNDALAAWYEDIFLELM